MFEGIMSKISKKVDSKNPEELQIESNEQLIEEDIPEVKKEATYNKEEDFIVSQSIAMGKDMKNEVEIFSKAFFQSKNPEKAKAYLALHSFLLTLENYEKRMIKEISYLEFKEKEAQIFTSLKNGFAQFLSKGAHLNDETKRTIDIVFGDIKKLASKGHRYWYYKIYIWQDVKLKD